ncbi:GPP34 family phosphoprotein [Streptomyces sp. NPDC056503]|uniref:GOLPH3/VPS74 family protein n=1 Tax=Streptomyces sp. NPDC056503 TaxID=3345842 RepID=UPI0036A98BC9
MTLRRRAAGPALHESLLLAFAGACDQAAVRRWHRELGYGLAAAVLLDLERTGRVEVLPDQVLVRDASAADDPVADALLERMVLADRAHAARAWLETLAGGMLTAVRDQLLATGRLTPARRRRLGLFPVVDHLPADERAAARLVALVRTASGTPGAGGDTAGVLAPLIGAARLGRAMGCPPAHWDHCPRPVAVVAKDLSLAVAAAGVPLAFGG